MKKLVAILLLVLALGGCRAARQTTTSTTHRDSTITVTSRPVAIEIPADTATGHYKLDKFTQEVLGAPEGHVIDEQRGSAHIAGYQIIRAAQGFRVVATAAGRDTTVFVHDTVTVVREKVVQTVTHVEKPTVLQRAKSFAYSLFWALVLLVVLCLIVRLTRRS